MHDAAAATLVVTEPESHCGAHCDLPFCARSSRLPAESLAQTSPLVPLPQLHDEVGTVKPVGKELGSWVSRNWLGELSSPSPVTRVQQHAQLWQDPHVVHSTCRPVVPLLPPQLFRKLLQLPGGRVNTYSTVTLVATHALTQHAPLPSTLPHFTYNPWPHAHLHTPLRCPPPSHTSRTTQVGDTGYGFQTTADEIAAGLDLSDAGRHTSALVTGATGGLGFETARVLASRGAHVFVCGRTAAKAQKAVAAIEKAVGKGVGVLTPVACALGSLADVQSCADAVTLLNKPLDLLVLNAGIAWLTKPTTYGNRIPYTHTHYTHTHTFPATPIV